MAEEPQLEWGAAEVSGATLTVPIAGETDDEWGQTFARTLALLSSGGAWGSVKFKSGSVTIEEVQEGSEENLRFTLDGAVQEANAHHAAASDGEDDADEDEGETEGDDADQRMTDRFRDGTD